MDNFKNLLLCILLLFTSCQSPQKPPSSSLRFCMQRDPTTLDPRKGGDLATSTIHFLLYEGLFKLSPKGEVQPAIAERYLISQDGLTYTFTLRATTFADGSQLTAHHFEKSWKKSLEPDFPSSNVQLFYCIKNAEKAKKNEISSESIGIKAINDKTLVVNLEYPTPYLLELLCFSNFHPYKEGPKGPIPNGAYFLKNWQFNSHISLTKNSRYWDRTHVKASTIEISILDNERAALSLFENGQLDFIGGPLCPLPQDAAQSLKTDKRLKIQPVAGSTTLFFNTKTFPFQNENLRKAFAYAISKEELVQSVTQMGETAATSIIPPILRKHPSTHLIPYGDEALAKSYLQKALKELQITPEQLELTYLYSGKEQNHRVAQVLQERFKQMLGINISLQSLDHKSLIDKLSKGEYQFGQSLWMAQYNDPLAILERFKDAKNPKNYSKWDNIAFSKLVNQSYLEKNSELRIQTLEQAENLLIQEMPLMPLFHWSYAFLVQEYVHNLHFTSLGTINYTTLEIKR